MQTVLCGSSPQLITTEEVKSMHTKVLLDQYRGVSNHSIISDYCDYRECIFYRRCANISNKNKDILKAELDTREHIPNKLESKAIRKLNKKRGPKKEKCCRR